jgi:hypothetical protein
MAYTVLPKENPQRRNKHTELTLDRRDGTLIGPELSWTIDWHPQTREWWDTWRRSEIAPMLENSDWDFLQDTALIHHDIWNNQRMSVAQKTNALAEIRQRVAKFGATYEDRLKLRIKFADASIKEDQANPLIDVRKQDIAEMFSDEEVVD